MNQYDDELMQIDFFKLHPTFLPFIGDDYNEYRILHIGESHFIPNYPLGCDKKNIDKTNEITLDDFDGWWNGRINNKLLQYKGWFNTEEVVRWYMDGHRDKSHGIFTNTLKSFCKSVVPEESFDNISDLNSKKYNYFAFMNFYQLPSLYDGVNFTEALYCGGHFWGWSDSRIETMKVEAIEKSLKVLKATVDVLDPKVIVVTSMEVYDICQEYKNDLASFFSDKETIWVDHPGSPWWNRIKQGANKPSRVIFEENLKAIYSGKGD